MLTMFFFWVVELGDLYFLPRFATISRHYFLNRWEKKATVNKKKAVLPYPVRGSLFTGLRFC